MAVAGKKIEHPNGVLVFTILVPANAITVFLPRFEAAPICAEILALCR